MKKFILVSKNKENGNRLRKTLIKYGFEEVKRDPDFVLSHGGDGTLLIAERKYPGIPKLAVRNSKLCYLCENAPFELMLKSLRTGNYRYLEIPKLNANVNAKKKKHSILAFNDIIIRNKKINQALRFSVYINNKLKYNELIGDGVVVATPFGSTGYFYSIARKKFKKGIGIAFNHIHNKRLNCIIAKKNDKIKIIINRGPGEIAGDNENRTIRLEEGDSISISNTVKDAKLIRIR